MWRKDAVVSEEEEEEEEEPVPEPPALISRATEAFATFARGRPRAFGTTVNVDDIDPPLNEADGCPYLDEQAKCRFFGDQLQQLNVLGVTGQMLLNQQLVLGSLVLHFGFQRIILIEYDGSRNGC